MATKTWDGTTNDWYNNNGADWTPVGDPASTDDVFINSGQANLQSGDAGFTVASITLSNSGSLAITDRGMIQSITGNLTNSGRVYVDTNGGTVGSTLTIGGTLRNSNIVQIGSNNGSLSGLTTVIAGGLDNIGTILTASGNCPL